MDEIRSQVSRARKRLILQQFLGVASWCVFGGLLLALVAVLLPRIWAFPFLVEGNRLEWWSYSWLGGTSIVSLSAAAVLTYFTRRNSLDAAIEVDRRFDLKERVSSVVGMAPRDLESPSGKALLADAASRLAKVEMADQFHVKANWTAVLPALPLLIAVLVVFFVGGATPEAVEASIAEQAARDQVKKSEDKFREEVSRQKKEAEQMGLKDAARLLLEIERTYDKQKKDEKVDRKQAMIRLNNIKKKAEQLRNKLAKTDDMRKRLNQLKDVKQGPADKAGKALKDGDFRRAQQEMKKLAEKIRNNELGEKEQEQLEKQLAGLQQQLNEHEKAKEELRKKIAHARKDGQSDKAEKLQDQLNGLAERDQGMEQLKDLADKLSRASQDLKKGNKKQAAKDLDELASQLNEMQRQQDQLESMDQLMNKISQAKNAMNCKQCQGQGCSACQGTGKQGQLAKAGGAGQDGKGKSEPNPNGRGEGQGAGDRPEEKTDSGTFDSKVGADPQKGAVVRTGSVGGPNIAGRTREEVKAAVITSLREEADPVDGQPLPRSQREHAKQYFKLFREAGQ